MEKKRDFSPLFPLNVTPAEVSGRCRVLGPAATKLGEPGEAGPWQGAGREPSVRGDKTRGLLQRPTGSVQVFVQARKMLKDAEAEGEHGEKKRPRNLGIFALRLARPHPSISELLPFEQGSLLVQYFCLL